MDTLSGWPPSSQRSCSGRWVLWGAQGATWLGFWSPHPRQAASGLRGVSSWSSPGSPWALRGPGGPAKAGLTPYSSSSAMRTPDGPRGPEVSASTGQGQGLPSTSRWPAGSGALAAPCWPWHGDWGPGGDPAPQVVLGLQGAWADTELSLPSGGRLFWGRVPPRGPPRCLRPGPWLLCVRWGRLCGRAGLSLPVPHPDLPGLQEQPGSGGSAFL